jgi:hypothetical protein
MGGLRAPVSPGLVRCCAGGVYILASACRAGIPSCQQPLRGRPCAPSGGPSCPHSIPMSTLSASPSMPFAPRALASATRPSSASASFPSPANASAPAMCPRRPRTDRRRRATDRPSSLTCPRSNDLDVDEGDRSLSGVESKTYLRLAAMRALRGWPGVLPHEVTEQELRDTLGLSEGEARRALARRSAPRG